MSYPLKNWHSINRGYKHGEWTFYGAKHRGVDLIVPENTPVYAPFNGEVVRAFKGKQGGYTCWFSPDHDNVIIRFLHLYEMPALVGRVQEGDVICHTGNTGVSTAPHLHTDISRGSVKLSDFNNFIDPEKYQWEKPMANKKQFTVQPYYWGNNRPLYLNEFKDCYAPFADFYIRPVEKTTNVKFDYHTPWSDQSPNPAKFRAEHPTKGEDLIIVFVDKENWGFWGLFGTHTPGNFSDSRNIIFVQADDHMRNALPFTQNILYHEGRHFLVDRSDANLPDDTHDLVRETIANERVDYHKNLDLFYNTLNKGPLYGETQKTMLTQEEVKQLYFLMGLGLGDKDAIAYWTGKDLSELLNTRIEDLKKELNNL